MATKTISPEEAIKRLQEDCDKKRREMHALQEKIDDIKSAVILPELRKKYIGKCFIVKNGYSATEKWWLYIKVLNIESEYQWTCIECEEPTDGRIRIERVSRTSMSNRDSFRQIKASVFNAAYKKLLKRLPRTTA